MSGPVIAVSGRPGSGKTTLARSLARQLGACCVEWDRYETFTRRPVAEIMDWLRRGAPYGEIAVPGLADSLRSAARDGPVVFDTPLGRAHPETGPLIGFAVWIECPADLALQRKLAQLSGSVPTGRESAFLEWMRGYLDAYGQLVRPACELQAVRVPGTADLILDVGVEHEVALKQIAGALSHLPYRSKGHLPPPN